MLFVCIFMLKELFGEQMIISEAFPGNATTHFRERPPDLYGAIAWETV